MSTMPGTGIIRVRLRKCLRSRRLWQPNPTRHHRQARNRGYTRCSAQESGGMGDAISQGEKGLQCSRTHKCTSSGRG